MEQKSKAGLRFLWRSLQGRDEGAAKTTAVAVNIAVNITVADAFIMSREFDCLLILGSIRLGLEWAHNDDVAMEFAKDAIVTYDDQ